MSAGVLLVPENLKKGIYGNKKAGQQAGVNVGVNSLTVLVSSIKLFLWTRHLCINPKIMENIAE